MDRSLLNQPMDPIPRIGFPQDGQVQQITEDVFHIFRIHFKDSSNQPRIQIIRTQIGNACQDIFGLSMLEDLTCQIQRFKDADTSLAACGPLPFHQVGGHGLGQSLKGNFSGEAAKDFQG